ncbi:hypothetical protein [Stygiobacter electus]|uniref:Uncharacterized protein n=1 Tax=Stygiobacter electus TaxID=3032292 RepID=A0AAE3P2U9_9BACT|nr:hypothetical protein [Stygiobacter electus]MDF1613309.1 hypothetical protein [Stygiobacter electus]
MSNIQQTILFVHWNASEAKELSAPLRKEGWNVAIEHGEGAISLSQLKTHPPAAVVISLRRLPSHGREFADGLWGAKWGRSIPIIFVDGESEKVQMLRKQFPAAQFTSYNKLIAHLNKLFNKA